MMILCIKISYCRLAIRNFVRKILCCRLAGRNFAYKILSRRLAASKFANKIAIFRLQRVIFYAKSPFHACKKQFCSQDCTLQIGFYEFCSRDSMPQACGKEFLSQDCHYTLAGRNLPREIARGRTQAIADLHKGHAACKLAEELVKPLLCCLLETLLKVPQPKHGG